MKPTPFVIAEAGVNHNGRLDLALELVDAAAAAGADAVKFQTFRAEELATGAAPRAEYQKRGRDAASGQLEMLRGLELSASQFATLAERCAARGIEFMSTPFDVESVAMLKQLGMRRFKVPSGEATNPLLLRAVAATERPVILSTGMCSIGEVEEALVTVGRVLLGDADAAPLSSMEGRARLAERVTILHCTTEYPAPLESVHLHAMRTLADAFGCAVGYSDHTEGTAVAIAAVALGAVMIEKHFTLDRSLPGPDHAASLDVRDLRSFVETLRGVPVALGSSRKSPQLAELPNRLVARRSVVARRPIAAGELFTTENLALKRPGTGIPSNRYDELIGRYATRPYGVDELIER